MTKERAADWLERYHRYLKVLKEGGEVGEFHPWIGGQVPPKQIQAALLGDKRWLWLPTYGGVIRLADEPTDPAVRSPAEFKAGEYFVSDSKGRLPGFSRAVHDMWMGRVFVRVPDGIESLADKAARAKKEGVEL